MIYMFVNIFIIITKRIYCHLKYIFSKQKINVILYNFYIKKLWKFLLKESKLIILNHHQYSTFYSDLFFKLYIIVYKNELWMWENFLCVEMIQNVFQLI